MNANEKKNSTVSVPFEQAYWVVPGKLLAGCYPGSEDPAEADRNLKGLIDCGICHIINLMQPGEMNRAGRLFVPYENRIKEIAGLHGGQISVERQPIKDMGIPGRVEMCRILDRIDASIGQNRPVYVHCLGV